MTGTSSKFIVVAPEKPEQQMQILNKALGRAGIELVYLPSLKEMHRCAKYDPDVVGMVVLAQRDTALDRAIGTAGQAASAAGDVGIVVALSDPATAGQACALAVQLFDVTVVPTSEPKAVADALLASFRRYRKRVTERERALQERWKAMARTFDRAIELRDRVTQIHSIGVARLSKMLLEKLDWRELPDIPKFSRDLRLQFIIGALLHDTGKILMETDVLQKPDKLDDKEWDLMKRHPELGLQALLSQAGFGALIDAASGEAKQRAFVGKLLLWPLLALVHHWTPAAAPESRSYPCVVSNDECRRYLRILGWEDEGQSFTQFVVGLFESSLLPGIVTGPQLLLAWAIVHTADVVEARRAPRPYHVKRLPTMATVIGDLASEAKGTSDRNPNLGNALRVVVDTLYRCLPDVEDCLAGRTAFPLEVV